MIGFAISALVMLVAALALLIPPLARSRRPQGPSRRDVSVATYRERLADLEAQRDAGTLDENGFTQARTELDRRLLDEQGDAAEEGPPGGHQHPYRAAVVAVLIPMVAIITYLATGSPQTLFQGTAVASAPGAGQHAGQPAPADVETMVAALEERLQREPGDAEGWVMLARSYRVMQRPDQALRVLRQAAVHHPAEPTVLVLLAEAIATASGNDLTGEPMQLVTRALALDPDFPRALWLAGIDDVNRGDADSAVTRWRRLLQVAELEPGARAQVEQAIARAGGSASTRPEDAAGAGTSTDQGGPHVTVTVSLDPSLASRLDGSETLFVFARATEGPPMPLAVARLDAGSLPVTVRLSDDDAMTPQLALSRFDPVVVTARVSRSGEPTASRGDLQGSSSEVSPGTRPKVELVIDQVLD